MVIEAGLMNFFTGLLLVSLGVSLILLKRRLPKEGFEFLGDLRLNLGLVGLIAVGVAMILDYFDLI